MKRHSLLFGIQDYPGTGSLTPLKCPHADVDALAEVFGDPRYMGEVGQVVVSKDATFPEAQRIFASFLTKVAREDVVIIHFSGHGVRDEEGDLYLCFRDAVEDGLHFTALNVRTFREWLEKQKLRRMLVTLDCCHSGAAGAQMTRGSIAAPLRAAEETRPDGTGLYILAAADATETAKEANGLGVFTHHLVQGIRTGAADTDHDGRITVSELAEHLYREVPKDAAQTPIMTAHKTAGTFLVAQNPVVIEEQAERKAKEEAAAAEAVRQATLSAALKKLREHVRFGSFGMTFGAEVETWILRQRKANEPGPQFGLVESFAAGGLSAVEFHDAWRGLQHSESVALEVAKLQRVAEEQTARERAEAAERAREKAEQEKSARERAEREKHERKKSEPERLEQENADQERRTREKAEEERAARQRREQEQKEREAQEKAERIEVREKAAVIERLTREKEAKDRAVQEAAAPARAARDESLVDWMVKKGEFTGRGEFWFAAIVSISIIIFVIITIGRLYL